MQFASQEIHSANQFLNLLGAFPAGWPVDVIFEHDGEQIACTIRLHCLPVPGAKDLKYEPAGDLDASTAAATQPAPAGAQPPSGVFAAAFEQANRRTVKLYGAGIASQHGYQSGSRRSPDGLVVTTLSLVLEASNLRVVSFDGHVIAPSLSTATTTVASSPC